MGFRAKMAVIVAGVLIMSAGAAHAVNITIPDKTGSGSGWYGTQEDQEVEPNCVTGQFWDLEGFYLEGTTLSMVGGYDFKNGRDGWDSGDIFIDVTGDVVYGTDNYTIAGNGTKDVANQWGYDYAIDLDFASNKYSVFKIDADTLVTAYYRQNDPSNPWAYKSGGDFVTSGLLSYLTGLSDSVANTTYGVTGGLHNVVSLDIGFIPGGPFTSHFTMECGNDNLMGRGTKVPEPGTMLLLSGFLVMSLPVIRRFRLS